MLELSCPELAVRFCLLCFLDGRLEPPEARGSWCSGIPLSAIPVKRFGVASGDVASDAMTLDNISSNGKWQACSKGPQQHQAFLQLP